MESRWGGTEVRFWCLLGLQPVVRPLQVRGRMPCSVPDPATPANTARRITGILTPCFDPHWLPIDWKQRIHAYDYINVCICVWAYECVWGYMPVCAWMRVSVDECVNMCMCSCLWSAFKPPTLAIYPGWLEPQQMKQWVSRIEWQSGTIKGWQQSEASLGKKDGLGSSPCPHAPCHLYSQTQTHAHMDTHTVLDVETTVIKRVTTTSAPRHEEVDPEFSPWSS